MTPYCIVLKVYKNMWKRYSTFWNIYVFYDFMFFMPLIFFSKLFSLRCLGKFNWSPSSSSSAGLIAFCWQILVSPINAHLAIKCDGHPICNAKSIDVKILTRIQTHSTWKLFILFRVFFFLTRRGTFGPIRTNWSLRLKKAYKTNS